MNSVIVINQRARSLEQKAVRRLAVLEAAEAYFHDVGYQAFSMAQLAKNTGVAKGTLYLYFKTREELFLTLYEQSLIRWSQAFIDVLPESMTSKAYAHALYLTAIADGTFLPLLIRLEHVIEHNVAIPRLIESKRVFMRQVKTVAEPTSTSLKLSAAQADQGPSLDNEVMPEDVHALIASFSSEPLFVKNAVRIIEGIRAEVASNL